MSSAGATQGRISHAPCTLACLRHILEKGARVAPQGACSFRRSDILNLTPSGDLCSFVLRGKYTVYAVGGVQQEKHGSLWEQCQDELRSSCKAVYRQRASVCASSVGGRSSSAPREARTEHEHHRMELHRSPSLCELVLNDGHATRPELWLARFT